MLTVAMENADMKDSKNRKEKKSMSVARKYFSDDTSQLKKHTLCWNGWVKSFAMLWYLLIYGPYIARPKQFKPCVIPVVVGSIVVVGALTRCALLHFVFNQKYD